MEKLNMKNLGGVFVVLACGSGVAIVLGVFRWCYNMRKMSRSLDVRLAEVFQSFKITNHSFRRFPSVKSSGKK